ncbi:MAG: FapA family protein [bacterium]
MNDKRPFRIDFRAAGVYLTVDVSAVDNLGALGNQIREEISRRRIENVDYDTLERFLLNITSEPTAIAPPQPEPIDGKVTAQLTPTRNEVQIMIEPPMGKGRKVDLNDVILAIKSVGGGEFFLDTEKIEQMLSTFRFRDLVTVGERRHGRYDIVVSKDRSEAVLTLAPAFGGNPVEKNDIMRYFQREGIVYGVKEDLIEKMVKEGIYNQPTVIAAGEKPVDGENAHLEFYFDQEEKRARPTVNEEGQVDFRELNLISSVKQDDPLVKKYPSTPGVPGKNIHGEVITPKAGKDVPFPAGLNCKVNPNDPNLVVAATDGQPKFHTNKVHVIPILDVPGDVDFSTGNINFSGTVNIRGNILSGFTVKAAGDIQIGGTVEVAHIDAGGNISIKQGIVGQDKAIVICRGNLNARFVDKATLFVEGNVYVDESIMYSNLNSAGEVHLSGKKGFIIGGVVRASKFVSANRIGASFQTPTIIEVGGSPTMREELDELEKKIQEAETQEEMLSKSLVTAEKQRQKTGGDIGEQQRERATILARDRFSLIARLRAFRERKEDLEEKLSMLKSSQLKVHVRDKVLPGVKIIIKNAVWIARDEVKFTTFYEDENEIRFLPYEFATR